MSRVRWWIAHRLDRPGWCWASLVGWALYGSWSRPLRECRIDWMCREDLEANGHCYCGKLGAVSETDTTTPDSRGTGAAPA